MLLAAATTIDFAPLANDMIGIASGVLSAAAPVIVWFVVTWLHNKKLLVTAQQEQIVAARVDDLLQKAIGYGQSTLENANAAHLTKVSITDPTLAKAASFAIAQAPALLAKAGYDVSTTEGQHAVVRMVTARMGIPVPDVTSEVTLKGGTAG